MLIQPTCRQPMSQLPSGKSFDHFQPCEAGQAGIICIWLVITGQEAKQVPQHAGLADSSAFSKGSQMPCYYSSNGNLRPVTYSLFMLSS